MATKLRKIGNAILLAITLAMAVVGCRVILSVIDPKEYKASPEATLNETGTVPEVEALQSNEGVLAFPGALGYAKNTVGGRNGRILVVNTVFDIVDPDDDVLSLREAISIETGPRTIVFEVGGVFDTGIELLRLVGEDASNVTLACQTAPAPGVILKTYGFEVKDGAHDIIMRHCTIRAIDAGDPLGESGRSITIRGGSRNIILDHMSISWTTDEGFQAYLDKKQTVGLENITLSNSIVAEGDADSSRPESVKHPEWGYHAMGPGCLNNNSEHRPTNCSLVNNFVAHNSSRNVMIWGGAGEMSNNIVYNWFNIGLTARTYFSSDSDAIINNNLMKSGPNTKGAGDSNPTCGPKKYRCALALGATDENGIARYLVGKNYYIPENKHLFSARLIDVPNMVTPDGLPNFEAATPSPIDIRNMAAEGSRHLACIGASKPERDAIDARVIQEYLDGTGALGIGENIREGGHNVYQQRTWDVYGEPTVHPEGYDTDQDGMPDEWETMYGLDPANPDDHSGDIDGDGYTNIEEYLAVAATC